MAPENRKVSDLIISREFQDSTTCSLWVSQTTFVLLGACYTAPFYGHESANILSKLQYHQITD